MNCHKNTLRRYLLDKRVELYEKVDELKTKILADDFRDRDLINLEVYNNQLNLVKEVIEICTNRNKF